MGISGGSVKCGIFSIFPNLDTILLLGRKGGSLSGAKRSLIEKVRIVVNSRGLSLVK